MLHISDRGYVHCHMGLGLLNCGGSPRGYHEVSKGVDAAVAMATLRALCWII
jgi:hypothetical protein